MKKRYVYVVTIDWVNDDFSNGLEQKIFSSAKKAEEYIEKEFQRDLGNYQHRFNDENIEVQRSENKKGKHITLNEYENYAENHVEYSCVKAEVE